MIRALTFVATLFNSKHTGLSLFIIALTFAFVHRIAQAQPEAVALNSQASKDAAQVEALLEAANLDAEASKLTNAGQYNKALQQGVGRSAALRDMQLRLLKRPNRAHPYYWASFIQSGEWANLEGNRYQH